MLANVKNILDNKIYKCDLKVVKPDSLVYIDKSKSENIKHMKTYNCIKVMVQRTMSKYYVREIITGKLIPVNYRVDYRDLDGECYMGSIYLFQDSPAYILLTYDKQGFISKTAFHEYFAAEDSEVLKYIDLHSDKEKYAAELNQTFIFAENNYQKALEQNQVSHKTLIKNKLRRF